MSTLDSTVEDSVDKREVYRYAQGDERVQLRRMASKALLLREKVLCAFLFYFCLLEMPCKNN